MIIKYLDECHSFTDDECTPYPAFRTAGCGCCASYLPVTAENLELAKEQARAWLKQLEQMNPVVYPADVILPK